MPTVLRTQVTMPTNSALPADYVVNTWHNISVDIDPVDDATGFVANLLAFYLVIDSFMSGRLSTDIMFDVYDLSDAKPRTPIYHFDSTLSVGTGDALPHEVAICLSYSGVIGSGVNPARHRGRIYLGPWDVSVVDQGVGDTIVETSVMNAIAGAAEDFRDATVVGGWPWAVYSPTTQGAGASLVNSAFQVDHGWVDDAFDTVRSRGGNASTRATWG